jgi:hypothetical protein
LFFGKAEDQLSQVVRGENSYFSKVAFDHGADFRVDISFHPHNSSTTGETAAVRMAISMPVIRLVGHCRKMTSADKSQ